MEFILYQDILAGVKDHLLQMDLRVMTSNEMNNSQSDWTLWDKSTTVNSPWKFVLFWESDKFWTKYQIPGKGFW